MTSKGIRVWISRDTRDGVLMFSRKEPGRGRDYWGRGPGFMFDTEGVKRGVREMFGIRRGQCREFLLVPAPKARKRK